MGHCDTSRRAGARYRERSVGSTCCRGVLVKLWLPLMLIAFEMVHSEFFGLLDGNQFLPLLDLHLVNLPEEGIRFAP